ncbi:kinase-like protein [Colletotrichum falcatum]|nr:kinase-like protein [Colletotrichum falcatum]
MFFSQQQIHDTFGADAIAEQIIRCECNGCSGLQRLSTVNDSQCVEAIKKKKGSLLVAVLVYLGKLHLLYPLIFREATDTSGTRPSDITKKHGDEWFRDGPRERQMFCRAWDKALPMFHPVNFDPESNSDPARFFVRPFFEYEDSDRFPYWDCNSYTFEQGAFGQMRKFRMPAEYLGAGAQEILKSYPGSTEGSGETTKYLFVRKMIKISAQADGTNDADSMESTMLRILTTVKTEAKANIITLIAAYQWRKDIHYIFPFVRLNLNQVLRKHKVPEQLETNGLERTLRNHWLWEQAVLLCDALSTINTKLNDPGVATPLGQQGIIAFHFDLKPANILVTEDGVLKITDFGQSHVRPLREGEDMNGEWTGGDPVYQAPEFKPTQATLRKARNAYIESGGWDADEIRVPLNYDVWSLGCIMVEIMTFIFDPTPESPSTGLDKLDSDRLSERGEKKSVRYFKFLDNNKKVLKQCVKDKLASLKREPQRSSAEENYNAQVIKVTEKMLCVNPTNRLSLGEVVKQLQVADENYQRDKPDDALYLYMNSSAVEKPGNEYKEVGWLNNGQVVSYLDLNDVKVEIIERSDTRRTRVSQCPCRFQVYLNKESELASTSPRRRTSSPVTPKPEFLISLAVNAGRDAALTSHQRYFSAESSFFVPLYLDKRQGFKCAIITDRDSGRPVWEMIFSFSSITDVCGFQRTFLLHTCNSANPSNEDPFNNRDAFVSVSLKKTKSRDPEVIDSDIVLQSWVKAKPLWADRNSRRPSSVEAARSDTSEDSYAAKCVVIFGKKRFLVVPLNKRDKLYKKKVPGKNQLEILPNRPHFKAFEMLKSDPSSLVSFDDVPSITLKPSQFQISSLEYSGFEIKAEEMTLTYTDRAKVAIAALESLGWVSPK